MEESSSETTTAGGAQGLASCGVPAAAECSADGCGQANGGAVVEPVSERHGCLEIELTADGCRADMMMRRPVTAEESARILSLHHAEHWPVGTIGAQLGRHHDTVERVLSQSGLAVHKQSVRPRLVDPFVPFLKEKLETYPRLRASRLWSMARERGYTGSKSGFRAIVSRLRPRRAAEAYLRGAGPKATRA